MIFKKSVFNKCARSLCLAILASSIFFATKAQNFPAGFSRVLVTNGLTTPTAMAFTPDGRIFVCQQAGSLRVIKNNTLLATPFITLSVNAIGERGLIGIALDPDFPTNGYVYLYHTLPDARRNRILRVTAIGDIALAGSEQVILDLSSLSGASNHNGGAMHFGPDGKLYVAIGENANPARAQNPNTYHGKILRINKDGSVPAGNPFTAGTAERLRTWALGVRNPFTIDFQPGTGKFYVNDVGQVTWEEINDATVGGRNFGWPTNEGVVPVTTFTNPDYAYAHGTGDGIGCAITGGVFFNPTITTYPASYFGKYFFQDYCNSWINYITPTAGATRSSFGTNVGGLSLALEVGPDGNLYFLSRTTSSLYKIVYASSQQPVITDQPDAITVFEGQAGTLSASASGAQPMEFQWKKNNANIPGQTDAQLNIASVSAADIGQYSVDITNSFGNVVSNTVSISISGVNLEPLPMIMTPAEGTYYRAGDIISFSGGASDPEEGALPATALSWQINFHHGSHVHDSPPIEDISSGQFTIPMSGETSDDVWYRLHLTAHDAGGRTASVYRDLLPLKSQITLHSEPPGLTLTLDGQPIETPHAVTSVEGIERAIGVETLQQILNDKLYEFEGWDHGGEPVQTINTSQDHITYTASFNEISFVPVVTDQPDVVEVTEGAIAIFSAAASGAQPMTYQWRKNGIDLPGETAAQLSVVSSQASSIGRYSVVVTNSYGNVSSNEALLRIAGTNLLPSAQLQLPVENSFYRAGETISFSGSGEDPEDGELPASALTWQVIFYHSGQDEIVHTVTGTATSLFNIPVAGEVAHDVWYRIRLTSQDSDGATVSVHRDVLPHKSQITLSSEPSGLTPTLDGQAVQSPHTVTSVQGLQRMLGTGNSQQELNGKLFEFEKWNHGGTPSHIISTPQEDIVYTAVFKEISFVPLITGQPDAIDVSEGASAVFSVMVSGATPFAYKWKRNGVEIPGETSPQLAITTVTDVSLGKYTVTVSNPYGTVTSDEAGLRFTDINLSPVPAFISPQAGSSYQAGNAIIFSGSATDPEDGNLPANVFSWKVSFHQADGVSDVHSVSGVSDGSYSVPLTGPLDDDVWYRMQLTVTDGDSKSATVTRDVVPETSVITLLSQPEGIMLSVDNKNFQTPYYLSDVVGMKRILTAPAQQMLNGKLYEFDRWQHGGEISQIRNTTSENVTYSAVFKQIELYPTIIGQPKAVELLLGNAASFSIAATGAHPLQYQWKKDDTDIPGQTSAQLNVPNISSAHVGHYSVLVSNTHGAILSNKVLLSLQGINIPPVPTITTPPAGAKYRAGSVFQFEGYAVDPEDGSLAPSALSWQIARHHDNESHTILLTRGLAGKFKIPSSPDLNGDIWYRISVSATDSQGKSATTSRDIFPYTSGVSIATLPEGLTVRINNTPITSPHVFSSTHGILHQIDADSPQTLENKMYEFHRWEHGGERSQLVTVPQNDVTYTAIFLPMTVTGIDNGQRERIRWYPNPVRGFMVIENLLASDVSIIDTRGSVVYNKRITERISKLRIDLALSAGLYILKIVDRERSFTSKFLVSDSPLR